MGPPNVWLTGRPETSLRHVGRKIKFKLDGSVQGFFDDDYASDADWEKFTKKGSALMCGLNCDDKEAGLQMGDTRTPPSSASPWSGDLRQEMAAWKWTEINPSTYSCKMNDHWKVPEAMKALKLDGKPQSESGENVCYRVEHWDPSLAENGSQIPAINQWYNIDKTEYQATNAHYEFGLNPSGGAIYGYFLDSPVYAASTLWHNNRKPADPAKLPKLRAFSDVLWGYWNRDNPDVKNIKYFLMMGISNDQTNAIIATCLHNKKEALKEWPGVEFDTASDEGHVLLGSPNGAAFAYFLMQHKAELGNKIIGKVTVFRAEIDDDLAFMDPNLVFHVEDVKEKDGEEKEINDDTERDRDGSGQARASSRTFKL
ncbi:uncharacterized protein M421DRAFT_425767 [Didymella exigua CBS 183.55]|uniref:Uncharacterized protein n=1 Tax=Didymella exigua CBS 183.55 TaxID=1150837 RepID=A0A6A5RA48_9PLEO|nr:uncharacterized protein M421DRAFT_425767 [Didymella exigua CBS 183.55]KAF1923546.1 hypothetical protein M421DRAFT_425767 [Didymella exigua CBS 183.55]